MHRSARTLTEFAAAKAFLFVIYHGEKVINIYSTHRYLCKFRVSIFLYSRSEKEDFETGVIGLYKSESTCTCLELTYSWKWEGFSVINCDCCRYIYLFIYFLIKRKKLQNDRVNWSMHGASTWWRRNFLREIQSVEVAEVGSSQVMLIYFMMQK